MTYKKHTDAIFDEIVAVRRDLHANPELEFDLERTAGVVAAFLEECGIDTRTGIAQTGVIGDIKVPGATRTIALRADMDALPIQEQADLPFKSTTPGRGHLCGHDAHTSMLLGAARIMSENRDSLKTNVRFIFQPCEENPPGGAKFMIEEGALDGVDAIYGLHVSPSYDVGTIAICHGPTMAQADRFEIMVEGVGGHAARPHGCIDPIVAGATLVKSLQTVVSRAVAPTEEAVVTVAQFHSGSAFNAIPSSAVLGGTVRTFEPDVKKTIRRRLDEIVAGTAMATGTTMVMKYTDGYPVLINGPEGVAAAEKAAGEIAQNIVSPCEKIMGGEDFAYYLQKIPGCFIWVGCRNEETDCVYGLHDPRFRMDEECMRYGMMIHQALVAVR